jgi:flagellar biosynthesis anti-sigma factor FlgM
MSVDPISSAAKQTGPDAVERPPNKSVGAPTGASGASGTSAANSAGDSAIEGLSQLRHYLQAAQTTPTERAQHVASLKDAVASGTYKVSLEKLAQRLLGRQSS